MFSSPATFQVPAVLEALGRTPAPWDASGGSGPILNWLGTDADAGKGLAAVLDGLGPLIGALALAGYETDLVALSPLVGGVSADHVVIEVGSRGYTAIATSLDLAIDHVMPPGELCLALHVMPRRRFRSYTPGLEVGASMGMPLPALAAPAGGDPSWSGSGATDPVWDLLHDPAAVAPDGGGWWPIGLSAGTYGELTAMAAAAEDASRQCGDLIAIELAQAWTTTAPDSPLPGLLGIYDADTWHFPDGSSPFSQRLSSAGRVVQGWLGRPSAHGQGTTTASPSEIFDFFARETWSSAEHAPGSLAAWLDAGSGTTGTGKISAGSIASWAETVARASPTEAAPTAPRLRSALDQAWATGLMVLHSVQIVDVLGREQIGDVAEPEWIEIDATGFYEQRSTANPEHPEVIGDGTAADDTGIATDTLQIKVAGDHLIGYWQEHPRLLLSPRVHTSYSIDAWHDSGNRFYGTRLDVANGSAQVCEIDVATEGDLVVVAASVDGGTATTFVKLDAGVFLGDTELDRMEQNMGVRVRELQRHPLHTHERIELAQIGVNLRSDIDAFFVGDITAAQVEASFGAAIAPWWVGSQLEQARMLLHSELRNHDLTTGYWPFLLHTTDYFERLNDIVQNHDDEMPTVSAFFEISPDMFKYQWTLQAPMGGGAGGNALIVGGSAYWWATMTIEKWRYVLDDEPHREWTSEYSASFGGLGAGLTIEATSGLRSSGVSAWVHHDLEPGWFFGPFGNGAAQYGLSLAFMSPIYEWVGLPWFMHAYRGKNWSEGMLVFGPRRPPDDSSVAQTFLWTYSGGTSDLYGFYLGVELAGTFGVLGPWDAGDQQPPVDWYTDLEPPTEVSDIEYSGPSTEPRFFDTDVSAIDDETRSWLRELCLEHLHLLRDRSGSLAVVGHADPVGEPGYNLGLSLDRARSTYEALADFLGPHLLVPEERTFVGGRGEWESLGEEHPDTFSGDRRVDLYLSGERVIAVRPAEND